MMRDLLRESHEIHRALAALRAAITFMPLCRRCSSDHRRRLRADGIVHHIARLFGWRLYSCLDCGHVFYGHLSGRLV